MLQARTLLCLGFLSIVAPIAPANVVHVPINQSVEGYRVPYYDNDGFLWYYAGSDYYDLDVNNDGITELRFEGRGSAQTGVPTGYDNYVHPRNGATIAATFRNDSSSIYRWWSTPLQAADIVGPTLTFAPADLTRPVQLYSLSADHIGGDDAWLQPPDKYLGFQFNIDGLPHFGWVRMKVIYDTDFYSFSRIELYDAAYETQPNTPLPTVPEPGSLTLIAGAISAIAARRRRPAR